MKKIGIFFTAVIVLFIVSCAQDSGNKNSGKDSVLKDSVALNDSVTDSQKLPKTTSVEEAKTELNEETTVASLLPKLPVLKFPLALDVDSFEMQQGVPIKLEKNIPWFGDFLVFPKGTKVRAIGRFYTSAATQEILFFVSSPNKYQPHGYDVELILSVFEGGENALDSRIVSINCSAGFGSSILLNPVKGKSFEQEENGNIKMTFTSFALKNNAFSVTSKETKTFPETTIGKKSSIEARKLWMN